MNLHNQQNPIERINTEDGWDQVKRPDILDPDYKMRSKYPGMDPDAMKKGPTEGHISITAANNPAVDYGIDPVTGEKFFPTTSHEVVSIDRPPLPRTLPPRGQASQSSNPPRS